MLKMELRIKQIFEAFRLATLAFGGDEDAATEWMLAPNPRFFDESPFDYMLAGYPESVLEWLRELTAQ